jgi:hypothetical protein
MPYQKQFFYQINDSSLLEHFIGYITELGDVRAVLDIANDHLPNTNQTTFVQAAFLRVNRFLRSVTILNFSYKVSVTEFEK